MIIPWAAWMLLRQVLLPIGLLQCQDSGWMASWKQGSMELHSQMQRLQIPIMVMAGKWFPSWSWQASGSHHGHGRQVVLIMVMAGKWFSSWSWQARGSHHGHGRQVVPIMVMAGNKSVSDTPPSTYRSHLSDAIEGSGIYLTKAKGNEEVGQETDPSSNVAFAMSNMKERRELEEAGRQAAEFEEILRQEDLERTAADPEDALGEGVVDVEGLEGEEAENAFAAAAASTIMHSRSNRFAAGSHREQEELDDDGEEDVIIPIHLPDEKSAGSKAGCSDNVHISLSPEGSTNVVSETTKHGGEGGADPGQTEGASTTSRRTFAAFGRRTMVRTVPRNWRSEGEERPLFVPQAWQIEIFLGGHMRRKHRPQLSESDEEEEKKKKATEEVAKPVSGPQVNLRAFNVGKLIKTVSTRQRTMLDDYDLRAELQRLKGVAPLSSALISDQMRSEMDQLEALLDPANKTAVKNTRRRRKKRRESNTGSRMSGRTYLSALSETPLSRSGADSGQPSPAASPMSGSRGASPLSLQRKASSPAVESPRLMNQWQQWQRSPPMTPSSALAAIDVTMLSPHTSMVSPASYQQLIPPQQQVVLPTRSAESGGSSVSPWQLPEDPLRPQDNALSSGATSDLIFSEGPPSDGAIPVAFLAVSPPAMYSPMLPGSASSIKPGSAAIVAASSSPPAHAVTSDLVDPSVIFPDRPGTSDSITGMAYPDSLVSTSSAGGTREARSASASVSASASASRGPGSPQGLRSADVSSEPQELSRRQRALAELFPPRPAPTPDIVNVSSSMFAVGGGTDTQNKMRRASNLRTGGQPLQPLAASAFAVNISLSSAAAAIGGATAAADAATVLKSRPSSREAEGSGGGGGSGVDASLASIGVDLDLGPETLKELEALKAMWSCSMYSGGIFEGDDLALYTGEAVQQLIDQAEDDAWQQYDQGAERLVDDLASAFAKQDQQHDPAAAAAAGGSFVNNGSSVLMGADSAGVAAAAAEGAVRPTHQLMKALAVMEDHVAASLDPEQLTGLHLGSYSDALAELMTRLMVAPMATRFLFWKKVQSLTSLKQRLIEDKALEKQLKDIAWSVAFEAAPPPPTRGGTQGMPEPGPLLQRPLPATTTGIQHQRSPWEPKGSWVAPGGPAPLRSVKMKLQSRVELEGFSSKDGTSHGPGLPIPNPSKIASSSSSTEAAAAGNNGPSTVLMMTAEDAYELEAHSAHEQLQVRQQELIELRRRMQEANTAAEMYPGVWIETPTIDEEHEALEELARVTVALNADMLRRRYQNPVAIGAASTSLPSGRRGSAAAGWHRDTRPGARESFQDTTEPWVTVPRPLVQPQPQPRGAGMTVTTHGASRATVIATSANELTSMAGGLSGVGVAVARLKGLPPLYSEQSEGTAGAASGQGQGRPIRGGELLSLPLAPIVNPPVHPDAERQPGNIHMTLPVPEALLDRSIPRWTRPNALSSSASMELSQRTPPSPDRMARMLPPPNTKRRPLPTGSDAPPWGRALPLRSSVSPGGKRRHQEDDDGDDVSAGAHANDASRGYPDSTSHRFASALAGGGSPLMQTPSMQRQGSTNLNPSQLLAKKILGDNGGAAGS
ncbi:hypothetical protein CEUSTIGMA_g6216.t1 [Chlamydomonas eustigma]|uniref:Uncharacterized protein n=1 Tax=Chlamydomonas eustigma TaxID=1157962 RepID=A0A250X788_9CHLO|nr:hypothetical protein CEUSTIGMA_g6216.t1 [Chlamydomonas eustigma]|eukprot:GAX78779.1 hypothetical protein CEUSTIGMA_g6216.t1 [Chlamydomonas eustigma]